MSVESLSYIIYKLTPLRQANRFDTISRSGLLLRYQKGEKIGYSDYFAWEELGDLPLESVLHQIIQGNDSFLIDQAKEFSQICWDDLRELKFKNHKLYSYQEVQSKIVKFKAGINLENEINDIKKLIALKNTIRIDLNGALDESETINFWNKFSSLEKDSIEYLEDPCVYDVKIWSRLRELNIPLAIDRVSDFNTIDFNSFDYVVFKPNIYQIKEWDNLNKKMIFSSYMGHDIGRIYCLEMLRKHADLNLYHGVDTPGIYLEQKQILNCSGSFLSPNINEIKNLLNELEGESWQSIYHKN